MKTKRLISDNNTISCNVILKSAKIISPANNLDEILDINIEDGIIIDIARNIDGDGIDFSGKTIVPGLVDMHCHLREPGFEYKETIETGTQSALWGGFSAVCPMANTNPVVDNIETLKYTIDKANETNNAKMYPICAITKGLKGLELTDFKALKSTSAIAFSDDGRPLENLKLFKEALQSGELIISHAEDSTLLTNPLSEAVCVARELEILRTVSNGRLHFAHISTKRAIELIRQAKNGLFGEGLNVTCETAPHYFTFTSENEIVDGQRSAIFKMNPPLRTQEDLEAVIKGLQDGTIDCIATDHAPHSLEEKTKSFADAPFGIVGFETALGASLKLVNDGYLTINQLIEKLSVNPSKILNLKGQGEIKIGQLANLTIIDTDTIYTVRADEFKTKCKITPFEGMTLKGKAVAMVVNGEFKEIGVNLCKQ